MKKMMRNAVGGLLMLGILLSAGCGRAQQTSAAADRVEVRNNGTAIQWKYNDETDWRDLAALTELYGADGKDGLNGADGKDGANGIDGKDGINGADGKDGTNGIDGKDGTNGIDGKDGANGADGKDGINGADGKDGINGIDGKDGADGKTVEVQKTDSHIQWRYEGEEWQNLVALADIEGPAGRDGENGENGKTPEFRANGNKLEWRYIGDTVWLNLYDLSALKGADGINGADGRDGADGKDGQKGADGKNGVDGKDGSCAGYFAASGTVYGWGTLPFTVKKSDGNLISYSSSEKKITLSKGHSYSIVFSGTVSVSAKSDDKMCGVSLVDGYNNSEMLLGTRTSVVIPKANQTARLTVAYNNIYTADEDINLTFQFSNMMFQDTNFGDGYYNITVTALD